MLVGIPKTTYLRVVKAVVKAKRGALEIDLLKQRKKLVDNQFSKQITYPNNVTHP